jgi:hypothetical protein
MIHEKIYFFKLFVFVGLFLFVSSVTPFSAHSKAKSVKTSYKRYSILKYKNEEILCEPYIVQKGDWLYKIFQKKGELSKKQFHLFLTIFKQINPKINNIDNIKPGIRILIPLKKTGVQDFEQITPGNIDVPVVEFSGQPNKLDLAPFIKIHKIKKGETVYRLLDKNFLIKGGGGISKEGLKALQLVNPNMKNIHIIYEGADIYLPDPSIKSQPWFKRLISGKSKKYKNTKIQKRFKIKPSKMMALKKYTSLIEGTLLNSGKMYFPEKNNSTGVLDLSSNPIIDAKDGSKILILSGDNISDALVKNIKAHWKNLKIQLLSELTNKQEPDKHETDKSKIAGKNILLKKNIGITETKKIIKALLLQANYTYTPNSRTPFILNNILLEASFGRVTREDTKDVLINFGIVYGSALEILKKQKFKILSISSELTPIELTQKLFSHLGYATWNNPSFSSKKTIKSINGLYLTKGQEKLFLPVNKLSVDAFTYLKNEGVKILSIEKNTIIEKKTQ